MIIGRREGAADEGKGVASAEVGVPLAGTETVGEEERQPFRDGGEDNAHAGVQGTKSGQNLMFEVEVGVSHSCTVAETARVEGQVREAIAAAVRGAKRVNVRFTVGEEEAFIDQFIATS